MVNGGDLVQKFIARLKKDENYQITSHYSVKDYYEIFRLRGVQVLRGIKIRIKIKKCGGLIFCGKGVKIEHSYLFETGQNLILEDYVYISALSEEGIHFGDNVTIGRGSVITSTGVIANKGVGLYIGNNTAIGCQSYIGARGGITIGSDVIMGPMVSIFSENHNYDNLNIPIRKQGESRRGIVIEDDCWIGTGCKIMDGVKIGQGSVLAAGAAITKDVPPYSVVAGVPAKIIKYRKS